MFRQAPVAESRPGAQNGENILQVAYHYSFSEIRMSAVIVHSLTTGLTTEFRFYVQHHKFLAKP